MIFSPASIQHQHISMKKINGYILAATLFIILLSLGSWGFLVHKTTHQLSVYQLPSGLKKFYYRNIDYLVNNAPRPDMRRNTDSTEAPKHFIDLEKFGDSAAFKMPLHWDDAVRMFTKDTLLEYGYLPYQVMFMKDRLTNAFRLRNVDSILFYSADIGHYVGDAGVPLHTTVNYDGQLTNQKGLHSLWESFIPEIELSNYNLRSRHKATYLNNPAESIMQAIQQSNALLPGMLAKEIEVSASFTDTQKYRIQIRRGRESKSYTTAFAKAYAAGLKNTINDQLIATANLIADFWYTSWVDGGKPNMDELIKPAFTKADKRTLKKEIKSNRHNRLLADSLLRSKKASVVTGSE